MKFSSILILITFFVYSQGQQWPIRRKQCVSSKDCYNEGECCQFDYTRNKQLCTPHNGCTDQCIYEEIVNPPTRPPTRATRPPTRPTVPVSDKAGFCPRTPTGLCRNDSDCPDHQKCCESVCSHPIFE